MFDTMTLTKIVGGLCGALLVFLLGGWASQTILGTGEGGGGHGELEQAYVIDTGEDEAPVEEADAGPSFAELFANADPGKGERVFNKCKACHQLEDGANGIGPHLYGVVGRKVALIEGFAYSGSLKPVADVWTPENLDAWLENPAEFAPGTTMGFAGLGDVKDRVNVIAYLDQTDGDTYEMAAPEAVEEAADTSAEPAEPTADAADAADAAPEPTTEDAEATEEPRAAEAAPEPAPAAETEPTPEAAAEDPAAADTPAPEAEKAEAADGFAAMVAAADPAEGKKVFRQCAACHVADKEQNRVGPHLVGVVGRDIAGVDGFNYSDAMKAVDGAWTLDQLDAWLEKPRDFAKGNRMSYPGLRKEEDRAAVIAYLQSLAN